MASFSLSCGVHKNRIQHGFVLRSCLVSPSHFAPPTAVAKRQAEFSAPVLESLDHRMWRVRDCVGSFMISVQGGSRGPYTQYTPGQC
jgi:hypothetical protein